MAVSVRFDSDLGLIARQGRVRETSTQVSLYDHRWTVIDDHENPFTTRSELEAIWYNCLSQALPLFSQSSGFGTCPRDISSTWIPPGSS